MKARFNRWASASVTFDALPSGRTVSVRKGSSISKDRVPVSIV
jgi:hypothetical protein